MCSNLITRKHTTLCGLKVQNAKSIDKILRNLPNDRAVRGTFERQKLAVEIDRWQIGRSTCRWPRHNPICTLRGGRCSRTRAEDAVVCKSRSRTSPLSLSRDGRMLKSLFKKDEKKLVFVYLLCRPNCESHTNADIYRASDTWEASFCTSSWHKLDRPFWCFRIGMPPFHLEDN